MCPLHGVCFAVVCRSVLLFDALLWAVCVLGCPAVCSLSSSCRALLCCPVVVRLRRAVRLACGVSVAWCRGMLTCAVLLPWVCCGTVLRCAAGCVVCCDAACCAVFSCVLSCDVAAPLVRCCVVFCWGACVPPLCCALLPLLRWAVSCGAVCGLCLFFARPRCPLLFPGCVLRPWCPWLVWLVP